MDENRRLVNRRRCLQTAAGAVAVGIAGCAGGGGDDGTTAEPSDDESTDSSSEGATNEFGYETTETAGVDVPLVPIEDALEWHRNEEAMFADARGRRAYENAHIAGAVHSPAPSGAGGADPVEQQSTDKRIVTYCGCPHHLSTQRGASLITEGYEQTYAIDEGFVPWYENGYPVEGANVEGIPTEYSIEGQTSAEDEGEFAWLWHDESGQREAAPIRSGGEFSLQLRFYDVTADSRLRLSVPAGERTGKLSELTSQKVVI